MNCWAISCPIPNNLHHLQRENSFSMLQIREIAPCCVCVARNEMLFCCGHTFAASGHLYQKPHHTREIAYKTHIYSV